jgi:hypothetical protein
VPRQRIAREVGSRNVLLAGLKTFAIWIAARVTRVIRGPDLVLTLGTLVDITRRIVSPHAMTRCSDTVASWTAPLQQERPARRTRCDTAAFFHSYLWGSEIDALQRLNRVFLPRILDFRRMGSSRPRPTVTSNADQMRSVSVRTLAAKAIRNTCSRCATPE